jgi:ABC-type branched-subunit amino acid transport system ATPase component
MRASGRASPDAKPRVTPRAPASAPPGAPAPSATGVGAPVSAPPGAPASGPAELGATGDTVLEVVDVDFSYGRLQVLFGVSLALVAGEAVALLGTNGAGKSTLLRVVSGLEQPSSGSVRLLGEDVTGVPAEERVGRGLVLVVGGRGVFPDLTVGENLEVQAYPLRRRPRVAAQRTQLVLETFPRLRERRSQLAGSLSGGEQQQLALAKALVLDPAVLCIDELSLGLSPVALEGLLDTVQAIHERGVALLVVEQSLNLAAEICPRALFLEKGTVRFEGRTAELVERSDLARAVFLGSAPSEGA